jgi:hypothetical protein
MSDWAGLLPAFVVAETVGLAAPVAVTAWVLHWRRGGCFGHSVRQSLAMWALFHSVAALTLLGIGAPPGLVVTVLVAGLLSALLLGLVPLGIGQRLFERRGVQSEVGLRYTTYGWLPALTLSCVAFFTPSLVQAGGIGQGHILSVGGPRVCLLGFCGVSAVTLLMVGLLGTLIYICPAPFGLLVAEYLE